MVKRCFAVFPVIAICCLCLFAACGGRRDGSIEDPLKLKHGRGVFQGNRPNPGYVQQLERRSMLRIAAENARIVSGSEIPWRNAGSSTEPDELLRYADTWLKVNPTTMLAGTRRTVFDHLSDTTIATIMREVSARGVYVAPARGAGSLWAFDKKEAVTGEDVVTYDFSTVAGSERDYGRLISRMIDNKGLVGMDLIPAAVGIGPDFFLAACNVREYPGIFCMMEVPQPMWKELPVVEVEWGRTALTMEQTAPFMSKGILPHAMRDDYSFLGKKAGWATTGEIPGIDGNKRRWIYRYYETPDMPVLNWDDPSQAAHRILSGSAVIQVGMQGQSLIGLNFEAFQGLEASKDDPGPQGMFSIEPALTASQSLSREIRRYGSWSWLRDNNLTISAIGSFLGTGTNFVTDNIFSPSAEHALLTGDAGYLKFMADKLIATKIDTRKLVHAGPAEEGLSYAMPHLNYLSYVENDPKAAQMLSKVMTEIQASVEGLASPLLSDDNTLFVTDTAIAAMAIGLSPFDVPVDKGEEVAKGHALLIFFRAMQPGVLMLNGQDLAGTLPLHYSSMSSSAEAWDIGRASRGSYALSTSAGALVVSDTGVPKSKTVYPYADYQAHQPQSFISHIGSFLRARTTSGLANGRLEARLQTRHPGLIALATRMPDQKSIVLSICNFSRDQVAETIYINELPGYADVIGKSLKIGGMGRYVVNSKSISVTLQPWEGVALYLGDAPKGLTSVKSEPINFNRKKK